MLQLNWTAAIGGNYQVQCTTNLSSPNWMNVGSSVIATNNVMSTGYSTTNQQEFYRVFYQP